MNVAVQSSHRNNAGSVSVYMERLFALRSVMREARRFRVIAVEGDSEDNTREALVYHADRLGLELELVTCNHGGPIYGSTEQPERLAALSKVLNAGLDAVLSDDDAFLFVESDLSWDPETLATLLRYGYDAPFGFDVFSPMVMAGDVFYDIWGFRGLDGRRFSPFAPFFPRMEGHLLFEVGSVGSCLAMQGAKARKVRVQNDMALVGWCQRARELGMRFAACPDLYVRQA